MSSNKTDNIKLTVLGCRGSMAVPGKDKTEYGCSTSSYLFEAGGEAIVLDAGNGVMNLPVIYEKNISLLISHTHIDHVLGIPMFLAATCGKEVAIYGEKRDGQGIRAQLDRLMSNPLWPVTMDAYPVKLRFKDIKGGDDISSFKIGPVHVSTMPANHPGGSTIFGLTYQGKKMIYATDFEHEEKATNRLIAFSEGADLVLYDAQYTNEEYELCKGYGHSTYEKAIELYEKSGAKKLLMIHHAPSHTDEDMKKLQEEVNIITKSDKVSFAKEGQVILL